ncbi:MAG: uridine kinase [Deltaproteobacteria bacterium]|nr:uridine kinase [Deltaproteobacteria bacterium]
MSVAVLGIAGGSASGKTTVTKKILEALAGEPVTLLDQDSYYRDLGHLDMDLRRSFNFDHPDAFDNDLMIEQLESLKAGRSIDKPVYSFKEYTRTPQTVRVDPGNVIIVEGIMVLAIRELRKRMDVKIFVEADDDIRFIRRLTRDVQERGRSIEAVVSQYLETVRPMHLTFVEPSKRYADVIIPSAGPNDVAISVVVGSLREHLRG